MRSSVLASAFFAASIPSARGAIGPDCASGPLKSNKICDVTANPTERAAALVAAMQASEKLDNLISNAKGVSRLGLPAYNWWGEALHGVASAPGNKFQAPFSSATSFPMPLLMSAAFDDDLIHAVGTIIGNEARAFGNNGKSPVDFWTPDINLFRDPRWGRGSETPGEDTVRGKGYTKALLSGLEGDKAQRKIIATCKHYVGYDMEKSGGVDRHSFNAKITVQDLSEYYMPTFQQCARDSNVGSIMCSYNAVNGVPTCADPYVLQTVLRDHWNWTASNNYITSDCEAVADISKNHKYASSNAAGTALAFNAGMDNSCEYSGSSDIPGAYNQKLLNISVIDRALTRQYEGLVRAGYFDGASAAYANLGISDVNTKEAQTTALQVAADGMALLKNTDNTLPLPLKSGAKVAMVGFWANDDSKLFGIYSGPAPLKINPVTAAKDLNLEVATASGPILQSSSANDNWTTGVLDAANRSDYIIYFGGLDTSAAAEGSDRTDISWPGAQVNLITKLSKLNKPLVVVALGDIVDHSPILNLPGVQGLIWANWPGQSGGRAVMHVISGEHPPAGRLPVTQYPANYTKLSILDMNMRPSGNNPGRTYRWFNGAVQPFGTGLHYTKFEAKFASAETTVDIQDVISKCNTKHPDLCPIEPLAITVANKGNVTSDFVALGFIKSETGPKPYPLKSLFSYIRLRKITGAETRKGSLAFNLGHIARVDASGNTVVYPGEYTLLLDEPTQATAKLTLKGTETVLDKWPQPPAAQNAATGS